MSGPTRTAPVSQVEFPHLEWEMATDMARRGVMLAPLPVAAGLIGWGVAGALSSAFAVGLVIGNLLVSAALVGWAARRSLGLLAGVAVGSYVVRLGILTLAVYLVKGQGWVELLPLGLTVVVAQLGLLWWETRHLSLTLAYPGLKPPPARS